MSVCKTSKDATEVLDRIAGGIEELKEIARSTETVEEDAERTPNASRELRDRVNGAYKRMFSGSSPRSDSRTTRENRKRADLIYPSEGWFYECVVRVAKDETRACRDIARKYNAQNTADDINKRLP